MNKKAKLSDLEPIGHELMEYAVLFDREEGRTVMVEDSMLRDIRDGDTFEEEEGAIPEWQKDALATARAVAEDDGTRFIYPPERDRREEFRWMEEFARQLPDDAVASDLRSQIGGRGSFHRFRNAVFEHRIEDEWQTFRDNKERDFLIEWCNDHRVEYEDDLHIGPRQEETSDREHLLTWAKWFLEEAMQRPEVERVALFGSICRDERKPRDLDIMVTVEADASVKPIATLARKLQGRISRGNLGADVYIVENGAHIGRACLYKEPWPRAICSQKSLRCAEGRKHLCDTSAVLNLDKTLVEKPPLVLWPRLQANDEVPVDVREAFGVDKKSA